MSEVQSSNITINSNSGSNTSGSFFDNLLNNVFKWGILLIGVLIIIVIGAAIYFIFFSSTFEDIQDSGEVLGIPVYFLSNALIPFGIGGGLARLFGIK